MISAFVPNLWANIVDFCGYYTHIIEEMPNLALKADKKPIQMRLVAIILTIFSVHMSVPSKAMEVKYCLNHGHDKKRVVIDAGHGGHDSGALGSANKEKDLALQMALKVGATIEAQHPDIEVIYTRTTDVFIPLHQRIGLANRKKADLFISIHCNFISNPKTRGTETFVMGLHRAEENLEVAKRENDVVLLENDYESNYEGFDPNSPIGNIILSTYQDAYLSQSINLAANIEQNLKANGVSTSRGVKQAGFAVLRKATMPSILVETGFISNKDEEQWLASEGGQQAIANSVADAISIYFNASTIVKNSTKKKSNKQIEREDTKVLALTANQIPEKVASPTSIDEQITSAQKIDSSTKPRNKKNETPMPLPDKEGIPAKELFKVQLAAMKQEVKDLDSSALDKLGTLKVSFENGYYKYQLTGFITKAEAVQAKEKAQDLGYKGAFIVASN